PSSPRAFPEPDMQLTQRPEIGPPVTDVEFRALRDAHPDPAPERRSEVVPRGGQITSLILERGGPPAEEPADLRIGRRHTDLAQRRARLPVVLVDGLLDHPIGQRIDVALVAGDGEVVELRDRTRLARPRRDRQPSPT